MQEVRKYTKLHVAARDGDIKKVKSLLDTDVKKRKKFTIDIRTDKNKKESSGNTPINLACRKGHFDIVKMLLSEKADINLPDDTGTTPLMSAVLSNYIDIVKLLLESSAKTDIKNADGKTALDIAKEKGYEGVCYLLQKGITPFPKLTSGNFNDEQKAYYKKGFESNKLKKYQEAVEYMSCAITASEGAIALKEMPKTKDDAMYFTDIHFDSYLLRGKVNYELKHYESAVQDMDKAIKLYEITPCTDSHLSELSAASAYECRALAKAGLNKKEEALVDFSVAITLNTENGWRGAETSALYVKRGILKQEMGQHSGALGDYEQAIKLNNNADAYFNRGILKFGLEQYQEAIDNYNQAIQLESSYSKNPIILSHMQIIKQRAEEKERAKEKEEKEKIERRMEEEIRKREEREEKHRLETEKKFEIRKHDEEEKKKQAEQDQQKEFMQMLTTLEQEKESGAADMKTLNTKYKALESLALKLSSPEFFAQRGDLYYEGALKASSSITKNMLYTNALQDYKQALIFNPFYEEKAERIELIEKQLKQPASSATSSSSFHQKEKEVPAETPKPLKREDLTQEEKQELERMKAQLKAGKKV